MGKVQYLTASIQGVETIFSATLEDFFIKYDIPYKLVGEMDNSEFFEVVLPKFTSPKQQETSECPLVAHRKQK